MNTSTKYFLGIGLAWVAYKMVYIQKQNGSSEVIPPSDDGARDEGQWIRLTGETVGTDNYVWQYEKPHQWDGAGNTVTSKTYYLIGNASHSSFVTTNASTGMIHLPSGVTARVFFTAAEAKQELARMAGSSTGGPSTKPTPPPLDPSWQPKGRQTHLGGYGFGNSVGPAQGW